VSEKGLFDFLVWVVFLGDRNADVGVANPSVGDDAPPTF